MNYNIEIPNIIETIEPEPLYICPSCKRETYEVGSFCASCGLPRGRGVRPLQTPIQYAVFVQWDAEGKFLSPPIGPVVGENETQRLMKSLRKKLRDAGRPSQGRVYPYMMRSAKWAEGWTIRPEEEG